MASFNFKPQFVEPIEAGTKGGTIRAYRRYPQKLGQPMHLFTGLRQVKPAPRITPLGLTNYPPCVAIVSIMIQKDHSVRISRLLDVPNSSAFARPGIFGFKKLSEIDKENLARFDGFASFTEMIQFWDGRLPFLGHWQCWRKPPITL